MIGLMVEWSEMRANFQSVSRQINQNLTLRVLTSGYILLKGKSFQESYAHGLPGLSLYTGILLWHGPEIGPIMGHHQV